GFPLSVGAALIPVAVPDALAESTLRYATAMVIQSLIPESILQLTEGVVSHMIAAKLKYAAAAVAAAVLVTGIGVRTSAPKVGAAPAEPPSMAKSSDKPTPVRTDREQ